MPLILSYATVSLQLAVSSSSPSLCLGPCAFACRTVPCDPFPSSLLFFPLLPCHHSPFFALVFPSVVPFPSSLGVEKVDRTPSSSSDEVVATTMATQILKGTPRTNAKTRIPKYPSSQILAYLRSSLEEPGSNDRTAAIQMPDARYAIPVAQGMRKCRGRVTPTGSGMVIWEGGPKVSGCLQALETASGFGVFFRVRIFVGFLFHGIEQATPLSPSLPDGRWASRWTRACDGHRDCLQAPFFSSCAAQ